MKKYLLKMLSLLLCSFILITVTQVTILAEGEDDMYITDLKVNNLLEPVGMDTVPTFRWVNNMSGYARSQSAYRIIVASTAEKAKAHDGDVWDSGKVQSNLNYDIVYGGEALASRTEYFFAVQVWDEDGDSVWSDVSSFGTGIFDDSEWSANWIGITDGDSVPCDITLDGANWIWFKDGAESSAAGNEYFRTKFTVDKNKEVDEVLLATTMDDYGYLFVNESVVLAVKNTSGAWKTGKVVNITPYVQKGDNIFAARVTNVSSSAGLIAKIEIRYTDGSIDTIVTDKSWKCSNSVSSTSGWERMGADDSAWATPDQSVAYGKSPWYNKVVMPATMQVNVGGGAPMLRKTFDIAKEVKKANIYISGLGLYELYVNGKLPDDTVLNPAHTQYEDTVHYRAYDVTDMLTSGKNAIAVELGNYFYNCDFYTWMNWSLASYRDNPKLLLELHVEYADGTKDVIVTDESWKTYEYGPIIYNNIYRGESHDARRNVDGWNTAAFDDSAWKTAVKVTAPTGDLVFENMEPLRRIKTFTPTVENKGGGIYFIENPVMTTGWAKIRFKAPAGTEITIRYCEKLDEQGFATSPLYGCVMQLDKFICSGGDDVYEPKYSYKGFRYIQIENYCGELTENDIECYFIANDIESISTFETGDSRINLLNELMVRTMFNNVQSKVTDTPVYEKNGWTGDFNFALESYNFNFDIANINQKFMIDMRDTANSKGVIGQNAPSVNAGGNNIPIWTTAFINGYYENWRVNGITTGFERNYVPMRAQMMSYINEIEANGWVWKDSGYADYHSPGQTSNAPEGAAIIGSAYVYQAALRMAEMAEYIGETEDAKVYRDAAANIKAAFNAKFYDAAKGYYDTGYWKDSDGTGRTKYRQTSNLIPLAFGFCPDEYKESVIQSIVNDIAEKGTHIDVGCVGVKYIFPVLSEVGYSQLCMDLLYQDTYPSLGYWISQDTTSLWEGYEDTSRSRNHYFLGTYTDWFYKNLAGVRDFSNGYETLTLNPEIHPEIGYVNYSIKTVRGELVSFWRFTEDNKLIWDITIPVGTTATVYLPDFADISEYTCITDNGESLTVPSGSYTFVMDASEFKVDKSVLLKVVEKTNGYKASDYTSDSWNILCDTLDVCKNELENDSATQFEVCAATTTLVKAMDKLCKNQYRTDLASLVESTKTYSASTFDADTFSVFLEVFTSAEVVLKDESATEAELEDAYTTLCTAADSLAKHAKGNVALGKKVVASSTHTGAAWGIEKLTDGNILNLSGEKVCGWTSHQETSYDHKEFAGVDLGAVYYINQIKIMPAGAKYGAVCNHFPIDFVLSVSLDGDTWTVVASEKDYPAPTTEMQVFDFETAAVRYIRFEGVKLRSNPDDANKHRIQLAELEAYNTANETDIDTKNVYVADGGNGDGRSENTPVGSLIEAMAILNGNGGTVVLVGDTTVKDNPVIAEQDGDLTITSVNGSKLLFTTRIEFAKNTNSNIITLDCPVDVKHSVNRFIFGGFNNILITDKFVVTNSGGGKLNFFGGVYTSCYATDDECITEIPYSITVNGGTYNIFAGGSYRGSISSHMSSISAPVEITINGGTFGHADSYPISANNTNTNATFSVSGNSILADNATLTINGGTFEFPVVVQGGMNTVEAVACVKAKTIASDKKYYAIDGDITVNINGGNFNGGYFGAYYTQAAYTSLVRGNFDVTVSGGNFKDGTVFDATQVKAYDGSLKKARITYPESISLNIVRFDEVNGEAVSYDEPIRVAFVGDSITEGYAPSAASVDRLSESYPAAFLNYCQAAGNDVIVSNYGVAASGFMDNNSRFYGDLVAWNMVREETDPDIVFFAMGTNDASSSCYSHGGMMTFEENFTFFVSEMGKLSSVDKVYISNAIFRKTTNAIADHNLNATLRATQERVAKHLAQNNSKYVFFDLYGLTLEAATNDTLFKDDSGKVNERLHPAKAGLDIMGRCCYDAVFNGITVPEEYRLSDVFVSDKGTPYGKGTIEDPISDIGYAFSIMKPDTKVTLHVVDTITYNGTCVNFPSAPSRLDVVGESNNAKMVLSGAATVKFCTDVKFDRIALQSAASGTMMFGYYNDVEFTETVKTVGNWSFYAGYYVYPDVDPTTTGVHDNEKSASSSNICNIAIRGGTFDGFMLGNYRSADDAPLGTYSGRMYASIGENVVIGKDVTKTGIVGQNYLTGYISVNVNSWGGSVVRTYAPYGNGVVYDDGNNTGTFNVIFAMQSPYISDAQNIARGKAADALSGEGTDALVDGKVYGKVFSSAVYTDENCNDCITVDLGGICEFNQINLVPSSNGEGFPKAFTISVSADGDDWETVVTKTDHLVSSASAQEFTFDAVNARYVKLDVSVLSQLSGGEYRMVLAELEVYLNSSESRMDINGDGVVDLLDAMKLLNDLTNDRVDASLVDIIRILKYAVK